MHINSFIHDKKKIKSKDYKADVLGVEIYRLDYYYFRMLEQKSGSKDQQVGVVVSICITTCFVVRFLSFFFDVSIHEDLQEGDRISSMVDLLRR